MRSFSDYVKLNDEWLATQPESVKRKYPRSHARIEGRDPDAAPARRRQGRRTPAPELQDAIQSGSGTDFGQAERASRALTRISPDRAEHYDTWLGVGMALSELGRVGFVFWEEWSKRSAKFEPGACSEKWPTFAPGDGLTLASLERWADEDDPREDTHPDGCTPDCPNRARVTAHQTTIQQLEKECADMRERNRFVTNAQAAAGIKSASVRDTVVELKKELENVPVEQRREGAFVPIRPAYMAKMANSTASTVNRHLKRLEDNGIIERKVETIYMPEEKKWTAQTYVRPLVDLANPAGLVVPSAHGGNHTVRCIKPACRSTNIVDKVQRICLDCNTLQGEVRFIPVNEVEDLSDEATYTSTVAAISEPVQDGFELGNASCVAINNDPVASTDLVGIQETQDAFPASVAAAPAPGSQLPLIDVSDPSSLPGVRTGRIAPDDPWIVLQQQLAARRASP